MKINILNPHGYCGGVKKALEKVNDALLDESTKKPIYLLGNIIHNKYITAKLEALGAITIESKNKTRYEMLDDINEGTVVFSAHGVSDRVREKALEKGLNIIDASCPNVLFIEKKIKQYLDKNYEIIYIGTLKHPECEAILETSEKIHLYSPDLNLDEFKGKNVYITNQTTLSLLEIDNIYTKIKEALPNAIIDNKICNATTLRQSAIINSKADLTIVVGDKLSSNSKKLCEISENKAHIPAILIENVNDLKDYNFSGINTINLTSAASTPEELLTEVYNYLNNL